VAETGQRLQGRDDILNIAEQVVGNVEFVEFVECGEVGG
jgi:hypothetical protein